MADPILYYRVVVNTVFTTADTQFIPGRTYYVTPDVYNSTLADNSTFSSKCVTADPLTTNP